MAEIFISFKMEESTENDYNAFWCSPIFPEIIDFGSSDCLATFNTQFDIFSYELNFIETDDKPSTNEPTKKIISDTKQTMAKDEKHQDNRLIGHDKDGLRYVFQTFGTSAIPIVELTREEISYNYKNLRHEKSRLAKFLRKHDFGIYPHKIGMVPYEFFKKYGKDQSVSITTIVKEFFRSRMTKYTKFQYKLFDMLRLSLIYPKLGDLLGCSWINDKVFMIEKNAFACALGIRTIEGSLFHKQGNFPCHGFIDCTHTIFSQANDGIRYFTHPNFSCLMDEKDVFGHDISYKNDSKRKTKFIRSESDE